RKESGDGIVVGVKLETVGDLAIEVKGGEPLRLDQCPAELVAIKRGQCLDRGGACRDVGAILPCYFRPRQGTIAHVKSELFTAQPARDRSVPVENPGPPRRVIGERTRLVTDAGAQPAGGQQRSHSALECRNLAKRQRVVGQKSHWRMRIEQANAVQPRRS